MDQIDLHKLNIKNMYCILLLFIIVIAIILFVRYKYRATLTVVKAVTSVLYTCVYSRS